MDNYDFDLTPSAPCDCQICRDMCYVPCFPEPVEAKRLVKYFADRLMIGKIEINHRVATYLRPACKGFEGKKDPMEPGWCTFYHGGKCVLHDKGMKPMGGRVAHHSKIAEQLENLKFNNIPIIAAWDSKTGRKVVKLWKKKIGR